MKKPKRYPTVAISEELSERIKQHSLATGLKIKFIVADAVEKWLKAKGAK